jgi:hypothetical protein
MAMSVPAGPPEAPFVPRALAIIAMTAALFALTLRIFYPGVMTYDARYIHAYIAEGRAGDWQSPLMTTVWAAIDPIAPGAGSMFLLIATFYWLGFTVLALTLARRSLWLGVATLVLALAPPAFVFVGIIWRDMLFAAAWLLAAALVFAVADRHGAWRIAAQTIAIALLVFGFLLRPNALFAAPILAAYLVWPERFEIKRTLVLYVPVVVALAILEPVVYYGVLDARHQSPIHAILVFDLAGITHFAKANAFPVTWTPGETAMLIGSCYQPTEFDIYWTREPCQFVMERLEADKIFGSPALVEAWWRAILAHPLAYLEHRVALMANFLVNQNLTMWTVDIANPDRVVFADNRWFMAIKAVNDRLAPTPLFRAGLWLLLCMLWCAVAWRRRATASGAFVIGVCGSGVIYVATFFPVGLSSDFRYALWAVLAGLAGTAVIAVREPTPAGAGQDTGRPGTPAQPGAIAEKASYSAALRPAPEPNRRSM